MPTPKTSMKNLSPFRIGFAAIIAVATVFCLVNNHVWPAAFVAFCGTNILAKPTLNLARIQGIAFDVQLTSFAHGIAPDFSSALADLMAPQCIAPAAAGQYIAF